jgi:endo-1,3(4)-beta-glucanase
MHPIKDFWTNMHFHRHGEDNRPQAAPPPVPLESKPPPGIAQPHLTHVNPFTAFSNDPPVIPSRPDHPVPRTAIRTRSSGSHALLPAPGTPLHTNKFYANFFLEDQSMTTWTHPYSLWWSKGRGNAKSWGMSITLIEKESIASGPVNALGSCNYFFGPIGIQHMCFSAAELGSTTSMTVDTLEQFSCNVNLSPTPDANPLVTMPVVQGMGFVTAVYHGCTPCVQSSVFFRVSSALLDLLSTFLTFSRTSHLLVL